jgi:hypothetical protein
MIPLQETFDTVVAHLRNQNEKAQVTDEDGNDPCKYLTEDGRKCAAGCLIKPEDYNESFEGHAICNYAGFPTEVGTLLDSYGHDLKLLRRLQQTHDSYPVEKWESIFEQIASDLNLTYVPKTNNSCSSER